MRISLPVLILALLALFSAVAAQEPPPTTAATPTPAAAQPPPPGEPKAAAKPAPEQPPAEPKPAAAQPPPPGEEPEPSLAEGGAASPAMAPAMAPAAAPKPAAAQPPPPGEPKPAAKPAPEQPPAEPKPAAKPAPEQPPSPNKRRHLAQAAGTGMMDPATAPPPSLIAPAFAGSPMGQPLFERLAGRRRRLAQAEEKDDELEEVEIKVPAKAAESPAGQPLAGKKD